MHAGWPVSEVFVASELPTRFEFIDRVKMLGRKLVYLL